MTVLPLYYHRILEASKLESIDSNETILEGTPIKCHKSLDLELHNQIKLLSAIK